MNWETIGGLSEFIAAVAVVASLVYLAVQIRDGKRATISATHYQVTEAINSVFFAMAENPELSRIYADGNRDPSNLTSEELPRYMMLVGGIFARYNNYYLQYEKGTLTQESWDIALDHMQSLMLYPGVQLWWKHSRQHYLEGMKVILDVAVKNATSPDLEGRHSAST